MKILGIERDQTACNMYRILQPLYKLHELGLADVMTMYEKDFANLDASMDKIMPSDIIVFQRPADENWLKLIKAVQKAGKTVVCDYDDDPFTTSPLSPAYRFLGVEEAVMQWPGGEVDELWKDGEDGFNIEANIKHRDLFRFNFKKADLITSTTNILADTFSKINKNSIVLPNLVDFDMYPKYDMVKKNVRIGWQGGSSHYEDLFMLMKPMKEVLENNPNATFVYLGDSRFINFIDKHLPKDQVEYHGWVSNSTYPYKLAGMNLDIGVCPLVDNVFNRNKSAIKYFEYSVVGAATVASNIPPYSPVIKEGATGMLPRNDDEWVSRLDEIIGNEKLRRQMAKRAYDDVYENHNANKKANLWLDAYEKVLKAPVEV